MQEILYHGEKAYLITSDVEAMRSAGAANTYEREIVKKLQHARNDGIKHVIFISSYELTALPTMVRAAFYLHVRKIGCTVADF